MLDDTVLKPQKAQNRARNIRVLYGTLEWNVEWNKSNIGLL